MMQASGNASLIAYHYVGAATEVITAVNTSPLDYTGRLALKGVQGRLNWKDVLRERTLHAEGDKLPLTLEGNALSVLVAQ